MLRSIKRAFNLDQNNPELHSCLVRFLQHTKDSKLDDIVKDVVKHHSKTIFSNKDVATLNKEFLDNNQESLPHRLQGARMLYLLDPTSQARAIKYVTDLDKLVHQQRDNVLGHVQ